MREGEDMRKRSTGRDLTFFKFASMRAKRKFFFFLNCTETARYLLSLT